MIAAFLLFSIFIIPEATASDFQEEDGGIEVVFDPETLNFTLEPAAILFDGWVNFTGYAVAPVTVHLSMSAEFGTVYLSQYDFVFHTPDSIPFDGLILLPFDFNYTFTNSMMITGTYEQYGLLFPINPMTCFNESYYWEEEEAVPEYPKPPESDEFPYFLGLPPLLFFVLYVFIIRPWMTKNGKKNCQTNNQ
jgi:hypothetical protein